MQMQVRKTKSTIIPRPKKPIPFLHPYDCQGRVLDVTRMQQNLRENPELLEKRDLCTKETPLIAAVNKGHDICVQFLLQHNPNLESISDKQNALNHAVHSYGINKFVYKNIIQMLLKNGSNPNWNHNEVPCALFICVIRNFYNITELLLKYGANPNVAVNTPKPNSIVNEVFTILDSAFLICIPKENYDLSILLIKYGAKINPSKKTFKYSIMSEPLLLKRLFFYSGDLNIAINNIETSADFTRVLSISSRFKTTQVCKQAMYMLHIFGVNLWKHGGDGKDVMRHEISMFKKLYKLRSNPLSLKCLSRIVIMNSMGYNFHRNYKNLGLPIPLQNYLEFPDVSDVVKVRSQHKK